MEAQQTQRYAANLHGVLSCYDRMVITGTLPGACYAGGMASFLYSQGIRIFDYAQFAEPLRERIRARAVEVCAAAGLEIEHVSKSHIRKEELVQRVLTRRGDAPGLVHVLWAMEACPSYRPWHDKASGKTTSEATRASACTTTFISSTPSWACATCAFPPGHRLACSSTATATACWTFSLKREGIDFVQADNAFLRIDNLPRAQALADALRE